MYTIIVVYKQNRLGTVVTQHDHLNLVDPINRSPLYLLGRRPGLTP